MSFKYDAPPQSGALRQGELLGEIWEYQPEQPPIFLSQDSSIQYRSVHHLIAIVMTPDCDLNWDFQARFPSETRPSSLIPHVLLCDVYEAAKVRTSISGSDIWKRVQQNQDERYHHFEAALIGDQPTNQLSDLYLDFKKIFSLSTEKLYLGLHGGSIKRIALIPPIYIHDLIHRFYGFFSRVALPD